MTKFSLGLAALGFALALQLFAASRADACGGFFCSSTPVDQNAERIVFKVRDDGRTDMIVQISYQGKAEDFAWVLPLAEPPQASDLGVFPQRALTALDAQTGVVVTRNCGLLDSAGGRGPFPSSAPQDEDSGVDVYVRTTVGNYEVAVIGSKDAQASADWLEENGFRISQAMLGFIQLYTAEGMKFLALKLLPEKTANDITPFKLTLAGESPSIPLRLSAVAAEPEMGIVVWILGTSRYEPGNADELIIDDKQIRFDERFRSNWLSLVARAADEVQGRGFVVEYADELANLRQLLMNSFGQQDSEQMMARAALTELFADVNYITRLYTRLSPEEMTYDPLFKRSSKGNVSRFRAAGGDNQCAAPTSVDPCDFTACGALGLCRLVNDNGQKAAACACAGGSTARTTFVPDANNGSFSSTVSCIDQRLSYLNPGERNPAGEALPDPCVGIDCGGHGKCVAMNMTPTCQCDEGYVARGEVASDGARSARCLTPMEAVPKSFYNRRPPTRDSSLPLGREEEMPAPTGLSDPDDPVPEGNVAAGGGGKMKRSGSSCAVGSGQSHALTELLMGCAGLLLARRRRRAR